MAKPTPLTPESAIAYVRATTADWGVSWTEASVSAAYRAHEDDVDVVVVATSMGDWVVWASGDGALYGEV